MRAPAFSGCLIFDWLQAYLPKKNSAADAGRIGHNVANVGMEKGAVPGRGKRRAWVLQGLCTTRKYSAAAGGFIALASGDAG